MNKLTQKISTLVPDFFFKQKTDIDIIFPFYHTVSDAPPQHLKHLYPLKSIQEFKNDLEYLIENYEPIDFSDILLYFEGKKNIKKKSFFLTFDDGLSEIYHTIAPILKQQNIPAIFFVNSSFIHNKDLFYRYKVSIIIDEIKNNPQKQISAKKILTDNQIFSKNVEKALLQITFSNQHILDEIYNSFNKKFSDYLIKEKPYLTNNQLTELQKEGFIIGGHSANHPRYEQLSINEQLAETTESINFVKENFPSKYTTFAFPFTDNEVSLDFFNKLFNENKIDLTFGTAGIKHDTFEKNIQRIPMENGFSAKQTIKYQQFAYFTKKILKQNIIIRK